MQVHSIISNTISEEILTSGHLSIRFRTDGFSLLLEDANFKPVILNQFSNDPYLSFSGQVKVCEEWMENHTLIEDFHGESTIIVESPASTLVPKTLFTKENASFLLQQATMVAPSESVRYRKIKNRPFVTIFSVPDLLLELSGKMESRVRIVNPTECLISAADQIDASVHQRGFILIEAQPTTLEILVIQNDQVLLSNRQRISKSDEIVYHALNTMKQLELDRMKIPLYVAGLCDSDHESRVLLSKYIREVISLPYFIRDLQKDSILENIILSEASKCE